MLKSTFAIVVAVGVLSVGIGFQPVLAQSSQNDRQIEMKSRVSRLGTGKNAKVEVKLRDNSKLKGYIIETGDDSFTMADSKTGVIRNVPYEEVTRLNRSGNGISMKTLGIIAAATAGAIVTWVVVKPALCDGGAQSRGPC